MSTSEVYHSCAPARRDDRGSGGRGERAADHHQLVGGPRRGQVDLGGVHARGRRPPRRRTRRPCGSQTSAAVMRATLAQRSRRSASGAASAVRRPRRTATPVGRMPTRGTASMSWAPAQPVEPVGDLGRHAVGGGHLLEAARRAASAARRRPMPWPGCERWASSPTSVRPSARRMTARSWRRVRSWASSTITWRVAGRHPFEPGPDLVGQRAVALGGQPGVDQVGGRVQRLPGRGGSAGAARPGRWSRRPHLGRGRAHRAGGAARRRRARRLHEDLAPVAPGQVAPGQALDQLARPRRPGSGVARPAARPGCVAGRPRSGRAPSIQRSSPPASAAGPRSRSKVVWAMRASPSVGSTAATKRRNRSLGPDDQDAVGGDALVVVDEPGGPVQADHGLARARAAAQHQPGGGVEADQAVLVGLEGGHRGPHGLAAAARQLGHERGRARHLAGREVLDEQVVDVADVADPAGQAPGVVEAGLVEALGERRPPVDDQLLAARVDAVEADPPGLVVVDPAEHHQLVLELVDGAPHHAGDVLLGQGVGAVGPDLGQDQELVVDRAPGAGERGTLARQVDGWGWIEARHRGSPARPPWGGRGGPVSVASRRAVAPGISAPGRPARGSGRAGGARDRWPAGPRSVHRMCTSREAKRQAAARARVGVLVADGQHQVDRRLVVPAGEHVVGLAVRLARGPVVSHVAPVVGHQVEGAHVAAQAGHDLADVARPPIGVGLVAAAVDGHGGVRGEQPLEGHPVPAVGGPGVAVHQVTQLQPGGQGVEVHRLTVDGGAGMNPDGDRR